jgi:hypothetical protein
MKSDIAARRLRAASACDRFQPSDRMWLCFDPRADQLATSANHSSPAIAFMSALPPKSGHWLSPLGCPLCAESRH